VETSNLGRVSAVRNAPRPLLAQRELREWIDGRQAYDTLKTELSFRPDPI
jgi:hypothetical protein